MKKERIPNIKKLIKIDVHCDFGDEVMLKQDNRCTISKCIIRGLETSEIISWYEHNVYKKLEYVLWNGKQWDDGCKFYLPEAELYDMDKLNVLAAGDRYKQQKYAFFFYGVVERLLGMEVKNEGMSGFMAKGASLW